MILINKLIFFVAIKRTIQFIIVLAVALCSWSGAVCKCMCVCGTSEKCLPFTLIDMIN